MMRSRSEGLIDAHAEETSRAHPAFLRRPGLPGPALGSFLAGASVLRRDAFLDAGGFHSRLWLGGEEELLAVDLATAGWELCYVEDLTVHHQASTLRDPSKRRRDGWKKIPASTRGGGAC